MVYLLELRVFRCLYFPEYDPVYDHRTEDDRLTFRTELHLEDINQPLSRDPTWPKFQVPGTPQILKKLMYYSRLKYLLYLDQSQLACSSHMSRVLYYQVLDHGKLYCFYGVLQLQVISNTDIILLLAREIFLLLLKH